MSFASLQSAYVPLHTALTFDSFSPALAACDDLLANLQSLHSALTAPSSSPSSSPASLSSASKQLLSSLSSHKAHHSRGFKQLHSLTRELGRQLDSVIASSLLDTATLTPCVLDRQRVDDVVEDALWREGLQDVAREFSRERAAVDREVEGAAAVGGEGASEHDGDAADGADDAVRGMGRMFDIRRRLEEREVSECLVWVREEEERLRQRLERLREAKVKEDEKSKKGRQDGDSSEAAREERMADDEDEDRVGLALDMFASPATPASGAAAQTSAASPSSAASSPPVPLSVQLTGLQSLYDDLHALHFDLHRIRFLQLLTATAPAPARAAGTDKATAAAPAASSSSSSTVNGQQALLYAQTHFGLFAKERIDDIRKLSGLLLFYPNLTASPYANILTPPTSPTTSSSASWAAAVSSSSSTSASPSASASSSPTSPSALSSHLAAASATFSSLFLRLHSLPPTPPLTTVLAAASVAYPQLAHYQRLPLSSSVSLELDLRSSFPFHSTFICPVTREPSHAGNEPVMLVCGHLISAAAMDKIVRGLRVTRKFKCPTCPREQTPQEVIAVRL